MVLIPPEFELAARNVIAECVQRRHAEPLRHLPDAMISVGLDPADADIELLVSWARPGLALAAEAALTEEWRPVAGDGLGTLFMSRHPSGLSGQLIALHAQPLPVYPGALLAAAALAHAEASVIIATTINLFHSSSNDFRCDVQLRRWRAAS